ncbi:alpha/beta hydrolase [Nocardia neocaledoniensis]|uniref:alpha/beta hydrolase n=1 Tax=Nocardia neocaledoniensis TaxID=236511 RepID=UPI00245654F8|nr:alpha/beta hydrolase [Nocardia neocaledoniensis]
MVIAIGVGVAVCGGSAAMELSAKVPPTAALAKFYRQQVSWQDCSAADVTAQDDGPPVRCAWVDVPLDYADPGGRVIQVAISRTEATGDRLGSVLFLPGGPGQSGLWMANEAMGTQIARRFDRIGIDPRGIGASRPALSCRTAPEIDAWRAQRPSANTPAGIATTEAEFRDYAELCARNNGTDLLAHLGTREAAQDLDVIRAVLGEEKLTAVGYSYGTFLGSVYAERFPGKVRALVLDGAVDPALGPDESLVSQIAGFQHAFDSFATHCAWARSECALGYDEYLASDALRELLAPLLTAPAPTTDPRGLSYSDAVEAVLFSLYHQNGWDDLATGLTELRAGRGDTLLWLADWSWGRRDDGTYPRASDAHAAIRCVDGPRTHDREAVARLDVDYRRAAPFLDDGRGTGAAPKDPCAFWPVPNTLEPHPLSIPGLARTVVVSTTGDPATPHEEGIALARQLGAVLLTYRGNQHTVAFQGNRCVDYAVTRYLIDLVPPPDGFVC